MQILMTAGNIKQQKLRYILIPSLLRETGKTFAKRVLANLLLKQE